MERHDRVASQSFEALDGRSELLLGAGDVGCIQAIGALGKYAEGVLETCLSMLTPPLHYSEGDDRPDAECDPRIGALDLHA